MLCAGLGLIAGAVFPIEARAQQTPRDTVPARPPAVTVPIPPPPDAVVAADSAGERARLDSLRADSLRADTLRAPLARAEAPMMPEPDSGFRWDREALFASGALNLAELLERIPGATTFRTSWIASPHVTSYVGDPARVRVFYDGIELDPLDPRTGGVLDLVEVPLWSLEEVRVERGAGELRVHARSWRYDRTIPNTRVDVSTGDLASNVYRGFFARRYGNGAALQVAGQQFTTSDPRVGLGGVAAGGRSLALFTRVGWARGGWSADALVIRDSRTRYSERALSLSGPGVVRVLGAPVGDSIPALRAIRTEAYLRAGYGDPEAGVWLQAVAASSAWRETTEQRPPRASVPATREDSLRGAAAKDTLLSRAQYVVAGGLSRWGARLSGTMRLRVFQSASDVSPSVRAAWDTRFGAIAARAERDGRTRSTLAEAGVSARPLPWLALATVAESRDDSTDGSPAVIAGRAEGALRLPFTSAWLVGGAIYRDATTTTVPRVYYETIRTVSGAARAIPADSVIVGGGVVPAGAARGGFAGLRGRIYRDVGVDAVATRWEATGTLRPIAEARAELYLRTRWLSRFPRGQFGLNFTVLHDYRSAVPFRTRLGGETRVRGASALSTLLEVRISNAVVSWQYRNVTGNNYATVPGFVMPRSTNLYGVRWEFFN